VLLGFCAELRILATSREPLRTIREVTWRVPSLAAPDPQRVLRLDELVEYAAVHLFVTRAQAVRSSFELRSDNAAAVARVCAQLEGIPLALELAAARTRALAVEQIAARLEEDFRLLAGGNPTGPSRQRTLEATLDWSHDLLTETEQILFRRLSVFAGGFDLEAAEVVCGGDGVVRADVLDALTRLVDKSLVLLEERSGDARYRLLEPIRQYARNRLAGCGETATVLRCHAVHYQALAEQAEMELWGREQALWLGRLERDHDNLRAALGWLLEGAGDAEAGRRFAVALSRFWHTRGNLSEGRALLRRALATRVGVVTQGWVTALTWASSLAHHQGDLGEAEALGQQAVTAGRELGDPLFLGLALVTLGDELVRPGDVEQAVGTLDEGVSILRAAGDRAGPSLSVGLGILGTALRLRGDLDRAAAALEEGLALSRLVGNSWAAQAESPTVNWSRLALVGPGTVLAAVAANAVLYFVAGTVVAYNTEFLPLASVGGAIIMTVAPAIVAVLVYAALLRFTRHPAQIFTIIAAVVFVISLIPVFTYIPTVPGVTNEQIAILALMHVVAAIVIVRMLTSIRRVTTAKLIVTELITLGWRHRSGGRGEAFETAEST
jgi:non-specific serine/threonine protein kinase